MRATKLIAALALVLLQLISEPKLEAAAAAFIEAKEKATAMLPNPMRAR